jgi:site-specific DNA recombinase
MVRAGTKKQRKRDESEWIRIEAPDLRIVSEDLWDRVKGTLDARTAIFPRGADQKLMGRPRHKDESSYLLVGFAKCSMCGGPVGTDLRGWGPAGARRSVPHYACLDSKRRGKAICINHVALRQDLLDRAILGAIGNALHSAVLTGAVEKRSHDWQHASSRTSSAGPRSNGSWHRFSSGSTGWSTPLAHSWLMRSRRG